MKQYKCFKKDSWSKEFDEELAPCTLVQFETVVVRTACDEELILIDEEGRLVKRCWGENEA